MRDNVTVILSLLTQCVLFHGLYSGNARLTFRDLSTGLTKNRSIVCNEEGFEFGNENVLSAMSIELDDCTLKPGMLTPSEFRNIEYFISSPGTQNTIVPNKAFQNLISLRTIILSENGIEEIENSAFSSLSNVRLLDLSHNRIKSLPSHIFVEMPGLHKLYLDYNNLSILNVEMFTDLKHLKILSLSKNNIRKLTEDIFSQLGKLEELNINSNNLEYMDSGTFWLNIRLAKLDLSKNKDLTQVYLKGGLKNLTQLNLDDCGLRNLQSSIFSETPNLIEISISNNSVREIAEDTFLRVRHLEILDLSINSLTELKGRLFKNNNKIVNLNLSRNNLSEIRKNYFHGLSGLAILDLSHNSISAIDSNAFNHSPILSMLNMSHNEISSLKGSHFSGVDKRRITIDASDNRLANIEWEDLLPLWNFSANHNGIKELSVPNLVDSNPTYVSEIHLEGNKIEKIYVNLTENGSDGTKARFYLSRNPLQCDCHAYDIYRYLDNPGSSVKFPDHLICKRPVNLLGKKLDDLKATDFVCKVIENCPENCTCTYSVSDNVKAVNCSNRNYEHLPFRTPYNTSVLYINRNKLKSLDGLNESIWENLTEIHAESNEIRSAQFYIPKNVKLFLMHDNRLNKFPDAIEEQSTRLRDFRTTLRGNSWPCDCSIVKLKRWLSNHVTQIDDVSNVFCTFSNGSRSSTNLNALEETDICSKIEYEQYVISVVVMLCLLAALVFYYRYKLYILSYLYSHYNAFYMLFFGNRHVIEDKLYDCFISYSSSDRDVTLAIINEFENKPPYYKFCIHERNWLPGRYITNNIVESVQNSRKTLVIISEAFLQSAWFYLEFQAAYYQTLQDKTDRLIIIIKGNLPDEKEIDSDVMHVISSKTYLKWGETWFWEKLRYAIYQQSSSTENKTGLSFALLACCFKNTSKEEIGLE